MSEYGIDGLRLPDRHEIEQLMYRYAKAADQADVEHQLTVFQDDCRLRVSGSEWVEGTDAIRTMLQGALSRYVRTSHAVTNISIDFAGTDLAYAESLVTAWHRGVDGKEWTLHGRYIDTWTRRTRGWKIQTRELIAAGATGRDESRLTMLNRLTLSDGH
mgnify:CR=1 FL=1